MEKFIELNGVKLLQAARRYSATPADADDAYQRTLEILLTKAPEGYDDEHLLAWALTVARNESLMEQRRNSKIVDGAFDEVMSEMADAVGTVDDRVLESEEIGQGREALGRIRPDQMRCLLLKAEGRNYDEIGEVTGFSYTKVNRCLTEGRKAFRDHVSRLDSGAECRRIEGVLSMMADGAASDEARLDAEKHLKNCLACRSTLREFRLAPDRAAELAPIGLLLSATGSGQATGLLDRFWHKIESAYASIQERVFGHATTIHQGGEVATARKIAAVAAASVTLVAGGAAVEQATSHDGDGTRKAGRSTAVKPTTPMLAPAIARSPGGRPTAAQRARAAERRRIRAASEADVARATGGEQSDPSTAAADQSASAGNGGDFNPQPQSTAPTRDGSSDPETGLAP